jgi:hypothetical protein
MVYRGNDADNKKQKYSESKLPHCQFVHPKHRRSGEELKGGLHADRPASDSLSYGRGRM